MASEFKHISEPREARFRCIDINKLETCEFSAKEAKSLKLTRLETSFFFTKVLYEIAFPPELRGETRYLKGPKLFQGRIFPELLITVRDLRRYRGRELDIGPQLIVARRIDLVEDVPFVFPKRGLGDTEKLRIKLGGPWRFEDVLRFWSYDIYDWQGDHIRPSVPQYPEFWTETSKIVQDCSRPTNTVRIQNVVRHVLGAYMDWREFQWHYFNRDAATSGTEFNFGCWKTFARMEAQHDVAVAMAAGAQEALAARKHYACRKILHDCLENNSAHIRVLAGNYPHPGWYVYEARSRQGNPRYKRQLAGRPPSPLPGPRGESVMLGVQVYDKMDLEKRVADYDHKHHGPLNKSDDTGAVTNTLESDLESSSQF